MLTSRLALGATLLVLLPSVIQAGPYVVHLPTDPDLAICFKPPLTTHYPSIKFILTELRNLANPTPPPRPVNAPVPLRDRLTLITREMAQRNAAGILGPLEQIDLSAFYLRLGQAGKAIPILESLLRQMEEGNPARFLVLANLAAAYHDISQLDRAVEFQKETLKAWPSSWPGWTLQEFVGYRRIERFYLVLLESRWQEARLNPGRPTRWETVDPLFPGLKLVGPSGKYEAGHLAVEIFDRLPPDAPTIVQQLLYWQPMDFRLLYLFGELLNSRGEIANAFDVMSYLMELGQGSAETADHRRILRDSPRQAVEAWRSLNSDGRALLALLMPGGANQFGWSIGVIGLYLAQNQAPGPQLTPENPPSDQGNRGEANPSTIRALPDWRALIVGFVLGWIICFLVGMQWREWQRRARAFSAQKPRDGLKPSSPPNQEGRHDIQTG